MSKKQRKPTPPLQIGSGGIQIIVGIVIVIIMVVEIVKD